MLGANEGRFSCSVLNKINVRLLFLKNSSITIFFIPEKCRCIKNESSYLYTV
jgi:hypothetical protein